MEAKKKKKKAKRYLKELIFFILWSIIFIKLFVLDIESVFVEKYLPELSFLLAYRLIFYLLILVIIWYSLRNKSFFKNFFYFLGFPFYVLIWKLPKILLWRIPRYFFKRRHWIFMYSYINSVINHFWSFRFNTFKILLLLSSIILTFNSSSKVVLYFTLISQLFLLTVLIYDKFKVAFQPIGLFKLNLELTKLKDKKKKKDFFDTIMSDIDEAEIVENEEIKDKKQLEKIEKKKKENIERIILIKSLFSFLSSRLKDFLSRRTYIVVFFTKTLLTFLFAWFLISMMNYNVFTISREEFNFQITPKFFDFIYYTFHSMLHGNIQDILPSGVLAKILDILAPTTSLLITGTLLTVFFTVKTEHYKDNLKEVIAYSDDKLNNLEQRLIDYHNYTMDEAMSFLEEKKSFVCIVVKEIDKIE